MNIEAQLIASTILEEIKRGCEQDPRFVDLIQTAKETEDRNKEYKYYQVYTRSRVQDYIVIDGFSENSANEAKKFVLRTLKDWYENGNSIEKII